MKSALQVAEAVGVSVLEGGLLTRSEIALHMLDVLDVAVFALSGDLETIVVANTKARELLGRGGLPEGIREAIESCVATRATMPKAPPARVTVGDRSFYVRVHRVSSRPAVEVVLLREEVLRDAEVFRQLNRRYRVTSRQYQILSEIRQGKTDHQIATELGLSAGNVSQQVHRMLQLFDAPNRTRLAIIIDQLVSQRA